MVRIVTWPVPWELTCTSDWYQARPKLVNEGSGVPLDSRLLRCTVNRSNASPGLMLRTNSVNWSFKLPEVTLASACGGRVGSLGNCARQFTKAGLAASWKVVELSAAGADSS